MKKAFLLLAATCGICLHDATAAELKLIPANTIGLLKVNHLQDTSKKIAAFSHNAGLDESQPDLKDPFEALNQNWPLLSLQGIDQNGDLAFLVLNKSNDSFDYEMVILFPCTDYDAFLKNFNHVETEGGVSHITKGGGHHFYSAKWGNHAAVSFSKFKPVPPTQTLTLPPATSKEMEKSDVGAYIDFKSIQPLIEPMSQGAKQGVIDALKERSQNDPSGYLKDNPWMIKLIADSLFKMSNRLFNETYGLFLGHNFQAEGANVKWMFDFQTDSTLAKYAQAIQNTSQSLFTGLPQFPYLFIFGSYPTPDVLIKIMDDNVKPIIADAITHDPKLSYLNDYYAVVRKEIALNRGSAVGFLSEGVETNEEDTDAFKMIAIHRGDAKQMLAAQREEIALRNKYFDANAKETITETPDATKIDGIAFDQLDLTSKKKHQGLRGLAGPVTDQAMLAGFNLTEDEMRKAIAAIKKDEDPMGTNPQVKWVGDRLPTNRFLATFIFPEWLKQDPKAAGKDTPPIGATMSTQGTTSSMDIFVPAKTVKMLIQAP